MQKLLGHAFGEMKKRGDVLTTLIPQEPWLIAFYEKMGYTPCFECKQTAISPADYPPFSTQMQFRELLPPDTTPAYVFYKKQFENQNLCIQKSIYDFEIMTQFCQNFEGKVYLLMDEWDITGLCFCFCHEGKVIVKDCVAKDENHRRYFFSKLMETFENQSIILQSSVMGMARIVDAFQLLTCFAQAHPQLEFSVKITDEHILENNFSGLVSNGKFEEITSQSIDFELSIEKLTQLLLGYKISLLEEKYALFPQQEPYMSLMME
jgi:predicted acetyltransferase